MTNEINEVAETRTVDEMKARQAEIKARAEAIKDEAAKLRKEKAELAVEYSKLVQNIKTKRAEEKEKAPAKVKKAPVVKEKKAKVEAKPRAPRKPAAKAEENSPSQSVAHELVALYGLTPQSTVDEIRAIRREYAKVYDAEFVGGDNTRMDIARKILSVAQMTATWNAQKAAA
jgi:hypothetical protein